MLKHIPATTYPHHMTQAKELSHCCLSIWGHICPWDRSVLTRLSWALRPLGFSSHLFTRVLSSYQTTFFVFMQLGYAPEDVSVWCSVRSLQLGNCENVATGALWDGEIFSPQGIGMNVHALFGLTCSPSSSISGTSISRATGIASFDDFNRLRWYSGPTAWLHWPTLLLLCQELNDGTTSSLRGSSQNS